jgi:leucyl-tRNA synthetase
MYAQTHAHAHTYKQDVVKLPIQINGKVRATLEVQRDIVQEDAVQASSVLQHLQGS